MSRETIAISKPASYEVPLNTPEHIVSVLCPDDKKEQRFHVEITGITYPLQNYRVTRPNSQIYSFEYIYSGEGTIMVGDDMYHPAKGDLYVLHAGENHHYYSNPKSPWHKIWFNVRGPLADRLVRSYDLTGTHLVHDLPVAHLFESFLEVCESLDSTYQEKMNRCSLIFHDLLQQINTAKEKRHMSPLTHADQLKHYLDLNIHNSISVEDMSRHMCLSPSQINRLFKRAFNITPYRYLLNLRMEESLTLLRHTNLPIKEIAHRLHFADEHYFSNFFKKTYGVSPSSFKHMSLSDKSS